MNEQSISQIKLISLFLRKFFRFNHHLIWSEKDQAAFTAFTTHFTADECLPFIINKKNEHPYFFKPDKITKQTIDLISFDPRLITENNLIDDNRDNLTVMNKIVKNNKVYPLIMKTTMKTLTIMKTTLSKIKLKTIMKLWYTT